MLTESGIFLEAAKKLAWPLARYLGKKTWASVGLWWQLRSAIGRAVSHLADEGLLERGVGELDESFFRAPEVVEEIGKGFDPGTAFYPNVAILLQIHRQTYRPEIPIDSAEVELGLRRFLEFLYEEARKCPGIRELLRGKEEIKEAPLTAAERDAVVQEHRSAYRAFLAGKREAILGRRDDFVLPTVVPVELEREGFSRPRSEGMPASRLLGSQDQLIIITGLSGFGKSTLLLHLAEECNRQGPLIPVLLRARDIRTCTTSIDLQDAVADRLNGRVPSWHKRKFVRNAWESRALILFIDGLDQVDGPGDLQSLFSTTTAFGKVRVIATGRPGWPIINSAILNGWTRFKLQPFDDSQVQEYLGSLSLRPELARLRRVLGPLFREPVILRLVKDLLLEGKLHIDRVRTRAELYDHFVERLIERQKEFISATPYGQPPLPEAVTDDVARLAFHTLQQGQLGTFDGGTGLRAVGDEQKFLRLHRYEFIRNLEATSGLWEFRHQSFQEYFAAKHLSTLLTTLSNRELQEKYINRLAWEDVLLFLAGVLPGASRLIQLSIPIDLTFAAHLLGRSRAAEASVREEVLGRLKDLALSGDRDVAWDALEGILASRDAQRLEMLVTVIAQADEQVAGYAASYLSEYNELFTPEELQHHIGHSSSRVRVEICKVLGQQRSRSSVDTLIQRLDDNDQQVREAAIEALGKIDDPRSSDALLSLLRTRNPRVQLSTVVMAISTVGPQGACEDLRKLVPDYAVHGWFVEALARLRCDNWLTRLLETIEACKEDETQKRWAWLLTNCATRDEFPALVQAFRERPKVRHHLRQVLRRIDPEGAVAAWAEMVRGSEDLGLRHEALFGLDDAKCAAAVPALVDALRDRELAHFAARALGENGTEEAILAIRQAMEDPDPCIRELAIHAVRAAVEEYEPFIKGSRQTDSETMQRTASCLAYIEQHNLYGSIVERLADESSLVWWSAADTVAQLKLPAPTELLLRLFFAEPGMQIAPARALRDRKEPEVIQAMLTCVRERDRHRLEEAISFLAYHRIVEAGPEILKIAGTPGSGPGRIAGLRALPILKPPGYIQVLLSAVDDYSDPYGEWNRVAALQALTEVQDPRVDEKLVDALRRWSKSGIWLILLDIAAQRRTAAAVPLIEQRFSAYFDISPHDLIKTLAAIGTPEAVGAIERIAASSGDLRYQIVECADVLPQRSDVLSLLMHLVRQGHFPGIEKIVEVIKKYPDNQARDTLKALLSYTLSDFGYEKVLEFLRMSNDPGTADLVAAELVRNYNETFLWRAGSWFQGEKDFLLIDSMRRYVPANRPDITAWIDDCELAVARNRGLRTRTFMPGRDK